MTRVLVIGCGPDARRNYLPVLEQMPAARDLRLAAVVDLEDQRETLEQYFASRPLKPEKYIWVPPAARDNSSLSSGVRRALDRLSAAQPIDAVFITTEPKAHLPYLAWAIEKDLPVLVEKPLSAPVDASCRTKPAQEIMHHFLRILRLLDQHPLSRVTVMAQRRYHPGYNFIRSYVRDLVEEFRIPISFVDLYYSDGQWRLPDEYDWENHPFKYGYGKLLHGGYHFIDLLQVLLESNDLLPEKAPNRVSAFSHSFRPSDALAQITLTDYERLWARAGSHRGFGPCRTDACGELDCYNLLQFRRDDIVVTTAAVNLLHNGFSRRAWREPADDTYKRNGRVRHERCTINVGPLLSIQVFSYEAWETDKVDRSNPLREWKPGSPRHFEIHICRNSELTGGKPFEVINFGDDGRLSPPTFVQEARLSCINEFFSGALSSSDLRSHYRSNLLMALISENLAREFTGEMPYGERSLTSTAPWLKQASLA